MLQLINKEISTAGVTLGVKTRPQFFDDQQHFINEAVKFSMALLENAKLTLIKKIFVTIS